MLVLTMFFHLFLLLVSRTVAMSDLEDTFDEENHVDVTCEEQVNISNIQEQLARLSSGIVTEEVLCFLKCRLLKKNYMSQNGILYPELLKKRLLEYMQDWDKNLDCLETIPPILTCQDVELLVKCIND